MEKLVDKMDCAYQETSKNVFATSKITSVKQNNSKSAQKWYRKVDHR